MRAVLALAVLALLLVPMFLVPAVSSPPVEISASAGTVCDVTGHCLQFIAVPPQFLGTVRVVPGNESTVSVQGLDINWGVIIYDIKATNGSVLSYRIYGKSDSESAVFKCSFRFYNTGNGFQADGGCQTEKYEMAPPPQQKDVWDKVSTGAGIARDVAIAAYIVYKIIKG